MSRLEIELNAEALMEWASRQGPDKDPAMLLAVETGMSLATAKKILTEGYVPGPTIRANVSFVTGIPRNTLWRPISA